MNRTEHSSWKKFTDANGDSALLVPVVLGQDYDGCFGNTNEAMRITEEITALHTHLTVSEIQSARRDVESKQQPFSTVAFIENELQRAGEGKTWETHLKPYIFEKAKEAEHRKRLLVLGARAVFDVAQRYGMYETVVTHGAVVHPAGPLEEWAAIEWQTTKVKMTPKMKDRPLVVTHTSSKGLEFSSWRDEASGLYRLPEEAWRSPDEPVYAKAVVHLDDKSKVFKDFLDKSQHMYGIHVLPQKSEDIRPTQLGDLPANVMRAQGLSQSAELLAAMADDDLAQYFDAA